MNWTKTGVNLFFVILALLLWQSGGFSYIQAFVMGLVDLAVEDDIPRSAFSLVIDLVCLIVIGVITPTLINRWRRSPSSTN